MFLVPLEGSGANRPFLCKCRARPSRRQLFDPPHPIAASASATRRPAITPILHDLGQRDEHKARSNSVRVGERHSRVV